MDVHIYNLGLRLEDRMCKAYLHYTAKFKASLLKKQNQTPKEQWAEDVVPSRALTYPAYTRPWL